MRKRLWLRVLGAMAFAALCAMPGVPMPGADGLGLSGAAAAQESIDIDTFYDELDPYGQWVWHPRFGYVWLPADVSPNWRPYTVGRWTYTDEYGWYWDSYEPFAWAVYHYGRWGYDPDYGWFWVPGDTWAPAWVQWRYSDNYVGWAPIGPRRGGYAYGVPVNYDPPIAESWVFVQPRYMTSRAISHYALPVADLSNAFLGATNVYRPQYRGGIVYNYGIPRDRVVKITRRPIYVQKIYKVDNWKAEGFDKRDYNKGVRIYAPGFNKNGRDRGPKRFADHPNDFKPKAKLKNTYKGNLPKGWGDSAKDMKSIAKEDPDAFKNKHGKFGPDDQANRGDRDRNNDKGDNDKNNKFGNQGVPSQFKQGNNNDRDKGDKGDNDKNKNFGNQGGPGGLNQFKEGNRDNNDMDKGNKGNNNKNNKNGDIGNANNDAKTPPPPPSPPPIQKVIRDQGDGTQADTGGASRINQGNRNDKGNRNDNDKANKGDNNKKDFGNQGGPSKFNQLKQSNRVNDKGDKGDRGDDSNKNQNNNKNKNFGDQGGGGGGGGNQRVQGGGGDNGGGDNKCKKHPEKPECQGRN